MSTTEVLKIIGTTGTTGRYVHATTGVLEGSKDIEQSNILYRQDS
jgi:hypothetical protein